MTELLDFVRGDATGLDIPAHEGALRQGGAEFLTQAFRSFGALASDNAITRIAKFEPCPEGNSGQKLFLTVEYACAEPGLHQDLFVKFSRDFADAFRDRRRYELEAEVRLAALSRHPAFPIAVPSAYFADFNHESGAGVLITQRVLFGQGGVEPYHHKCMDHGLDDPLSYYKTTMTALARLAGAHKAGRLSPQLENLFPFDAEKAAADLPISVDAASLKQKIVAYAEFAQKCRRILPEHLTQTAFIEKFEREALLFLAHEKALRAFLHADPDLVALCHWNTNIDNAWFWRDASGALQCGLLDWGMVRQMNAAYGIWGGLSAAGIEIFDNHLDELLGVFARELEARGGPRVDAERLATHFDLSLMLLGLALMLDVPAMALSRLPELAEVESARDPILRKDEVARCFTHVFANFLNLWDRRDFSASIRRALASQAGA